MQFLQEDPDISIVLNNLLSRYQKYDDRFKQSNRPDQSELNKMRSEITSFDENVAFSFSYLKSIVNIYFSNIHLAINDFISPTNADELRQQRFIDECIKPIQIYIELQIKSALHAINILKRYKVYCEWYGRKDLLLVKKDEPDITKKHLARFLFDSGYTYPLVEVVVPSGRIDNLVGDKYSVIVEAKIHRNGNPQTTFEKVFNQAYKRTQDLNLPEAFCIIFNRERADIVVNGSDGNVDICFYKTKNNSRIYFLVINLYESEDSEKSLPQKKVDLEGLN
ncbi:MAG: hypothetical protein HY428_00920 [Candidatus Levybacteria bacterium]|nr:hypothetical protein [Candidatus Levybacteria bacterium]